MNNSPPDKCAEPVRMLAELEAMELSLARQLMDRAKAQADPLAAVPLLEQALAVVSGSMRTRSLMARLRVERPRRSRLQ